MSDSYESITSFTTAGQNTQNTDDPIESGNDDFDYLYFIKFLYKRDIQIIQLSQLNPPGPDGTMESEMIGTGSSMNVFFSKWETRAVALKLPRHDRRHYNRLMHDLFFEIQVTSHKSLVEHPNIVTLLGISFLEGASKIEPQVYPILVVEAAHSQHPDLKQYLQSIEEPTPLSLVYELIGDIADGLAALHGLGVVHGDIKPENVLLFESKRLVAKLADFGSCGIDVSKDPPRGGTEAWAPPEFSHFYRSVGEISSDIYSFGLVCGYLASNGETLQFTGGKIDQVFLKEAIGICYPLPPVPLEPLFQLLNDTTEEISKRGCLLTEVRTKLLGTYIPISRQCLTLIGPVEHRIGFECKFHSRKVSLVRF